MSVRFFLLLLALAAWPLAGQSAGSAAGSQRALFVEAESALAAGESVDVDAVVERLGDYPLAPYLIYRDLTHRLDQAAPGEIIAFRQDYGELPVTGLLERRWLARAGHREDWSGFRRVDAGQGGADLACFRLRARRDADGVDAAWLERARALWNVAHSQPSACDPVFEVLYERDALPAPLRWERIEALMKSGATGLARALADRLEPAQRQTLRAWLSVVADPAPRLREPDFDVTSPVGLTIFTDGLRRLARADQDAALDVLAGVPVSAEWLSKQDRRDLRRYIALRAAYDRDEQALALLDGLPAAERDPHVAKWLARAALSQQDWRRLRGAILDLPPAMQREPEWRYWRAVALARTGDRVTAAQILEELSQRRHYYGFLAADLLQRPYAMNHAPAPRDAAAVAELGERPGLRRARELFELGYHEEARREWYAALAGADATTWRNAAHLALDWGWYGRTVHAANRAGLHDALELRFPLAFRDQLKAQAEATGVDPALAYALIRKESAFDPGAVSRVGALGLMQLMPGTARRVAADLGEPAPGRGDLLKPDANLRLGHVYLDRMLQRFGGSTVAAVAAYNAGPTRTEGWREENAGVIGSLWVENITYGETRDYVKSVMAFRAVFDWRLGGETRRLTPALQTAAAGNVVASRDTPR
ncbi:transglycosylase SLT domain-containing protein [Ectothiorhodospiraceae bacterium WFHF3C12]|nr:transglycosylase SLT domain-containing protein [Ectothiorhodospiraceae bacterium WFHF3C12]